MPRAVVLDTCALFPQHLRDTLLRLAERELYVPRWSQDTLRELERNLARKAGVRRSSIDRLLTQMYESFPEAAVGDYDHLIPFMTCHEKDRHVLAAAVESKAAAIVTFNLRDFPAESTNPRGIRVYHPDEFLLRLLETDTLDVIDELERQAASNRRDPRTLPALLDALARVQVPEFAHEVRRLRRDPPRATP